MEKLGNIGPYWTAYFAPFLMDSMAANLNSLAPPLQGNRFKVALGSLRSRFDRLALHNRFALVGSAISLVGILLIGNHATSTIEAGVVRNSAISSAVYMESFIAPLSQELATQQEFSPATIDHMRQVLASPPLADRIISAKIWRENGLLAISSDTELIGQIFAPTEDLSAAWDGKISAAFDELDEEENTLERAKGLPLLEVYNPIHSIVTGEVIAVAEFYLDARELEQDLRLARGQAWAIVALVTAATFAAQFGVVRSGNRTIAAQKRDLETRLDEVARMSAQNSTLRNRVQAAARKVSETNERYMRRVSADLHDGPAQAIALASLRLDALLRRSGTSPADPEVAVLRASLDEALRDVRDLCRGLALPELEGRTLEETLELAISAHERRTGESIRRPYQGSTRLTPTAPHPILICVYRFTQEALTNAFRHAGGATVTVDCNWDGDRLMVTVSDHGPGFDPGNRSDKGLGLAGLRERVESIGGEFLLHSEPGEGTRVTCCLAIEGAS